MKRALQTYIDRQTFRPTWGGAFVNPFYIARRGLARSIERHAGALGGRLLDVGCGSKPYSDLFRVDEYVGLDLDTPRARATGAADLFYDGGRFPADDGSFDSVVCNQVLEHVFEPDRFVQEVRRVLKPGGLLLLTVPFVWDEHEQPYDYARYSTFGLSALLERNGLTVTVHERIGADVSTVFQLGNAYLYKVLPSSARARFVACLLLMAPVTLIGLLLGRVLPGNPDLFLDQLVVARKENP